MNVRIFFFFFWTPELYTVAQYWDPEGELEQSRNELLGTVINYIGLFLQLCATCSLTLPPSPSVPPPAGHLAWQIALLPPELESGRSSCRSSAVHASSIDCPSTDVGLYTAMGCMPQARRASATGGQVHCPLWNREVRHDRPRVPHCSGSSPRLCACGESKPRTPSHVTKLSKLPPCKTSQPNYNKRLKFGRIFVALSRVRCRSNIHLINHANTSFEEAYGCISRHRPDPNVMAFYRGFTGNPENGLLWDMQLALGVPNNLH
jgi:hypothetical protein